MPHCGRVQLAMIGTVRGTDLGISIVKVRRVVFLESFSSMLYSGTLALVSDHSTHCPSCTQFLQHFLVSITLEDFDNVHLI